MPTFTTYCEPAEAAPEASDLDAKYETAEGEDRPTCESPIHTHGEPPNRRLAAIEPSHPDDYQIVTWINGLPYTRIALRRRAERLGLPAPVSYEDAAR